MITPKNQPGVNKPEPEYSDTAEATADTSSEKLTTGAVYTGEITSREVDGTYNVTLDAPAVSIVGVRLASPVFGGLAGFNVKSVLAADTRVKVAYGRTPFIYATISPAPTDWRNAARRSVVWGGDVDGSAGVVDKFSDKAQDLVEGEMEVSNMFGMSMDFLTTMLRMKAGDRAVVECCLINDMVRVISQQYRHISGIGEDLIYDQGRPTMERTWSSYRHELFGKFAERDPLSVMRGDEADREELSQERVEAVGRFRLVELVGFAGDFIHSFVTDPAETIVKMTEDGAKSGAGKSWEHRHTDGSYIIQSTADIRLERVVRIPVPVRKVSHEDPSATKGRAYESLVKKFLKLPDNLTGENSYQMAYHLRSYARWLTRYQAFARIHQLNSDYRILSEAESPVPDPNNGEKDRTDENAGASYDEVYACFTIMRDGSIVTHDGYGSSTVMSNGNIQMSAARHIDLEAAGDIRMIAGGSILTKARRNIELSAASGGVIIHSYSWLKMLCERGTTWIRSNAITDGSYTPASKSGHADGPLPEIQANAEGNGVGILIEATEGNTVLRSERGIDISVDGSPVDEELTHEIILHTPGGVTVSAKKKLLIKAGGALAIVSSKLYLTASQLFSSARDFVVGDNAAEPDLRLQSGALSVGSVVTNSVRANTVTDGADVDPPAAIDVADATIIQESKEAKPTLTWVGSQVGPQWSFQTTAEYIWDTREKSPSAIPETLTQQYLRLDTPSDTWGGNGWDTWTLNDTLEGYRTRKKAGFGSFEKQLRANDEGEDLHAVSGTELADTIQPEFTWETEVLQMKFLQR